MLLNLYSKEQKIIVVILSLLGCCDDIVDVVFVHFGDMDVEIIFHIAWIRFLYVPV